VVVGKSTFIAALILAMVALLVVLVYRSWSHESSFDELRSEHARLEQELTLARRDSAVLRNVTKLGAPTVEVGSDEVVERVSPRAEVIAPAIASGQVGPASDDYSIHVETKFESEPIDRAWSPERELHGRVTGILPAGSSIRKLDCRSSMCRMETSHRDVESYRAFTLSVVSVDGAPPVWTGPAYFNVIREPARPDDELVAVAYLGRESLPSLEK
jgi:hypothetical protein